MIKEKIVLKDCDLLFANPIDIEGQGFGPLAKNEGWLFDQKNMESNHLYLPVRLGFQKFLLSPEVLFQFQYCFLNF